MKSTKNTNTKSKNSKGCCNSGAKNTNNSSSKKSGGAKNSKNSAQEEDGDPFGSYTGNPIGWGKYEEPVQDADDL